MFVFFVIVLVFVLQVQVLPALGLKVDLMLVTAAYLGLVYGWRRGAGTGLVFGFLRDIVSGTALGLAPVGMVTCGMLAGYTRQRLLLRNKVIRVGLIFILTLVNMFIYLLLSTFFYHKAFFCAFSSQWFDICLGNSLAAVVLFWFLDRYE